MTTTTATANIVDPTRDALADDHDHVFHSWSAQDQISPALVTDASGSRFTADGTEYLDFSSQLVNVNIGYQHPRLVEAIKAACDDVMTVSPAMAHAARSEAARLVAEVGPDGMDHVFFTNGGAEAIENATRMARLHTGRQKVLAAYRSYHGATAGAITVTGEPRRWASEPGYPGVVHFWGPYPYRSAFHSTSPQEETERALAHLAATIAAEGPHTIAAIVLETVVGTNGILVPPPGYLEGVRRLCDEHGILYIADEVMAGFARCGEWFAVDHWGVVPDLITFAKGVNSGYVPIGGVLMSGPVVDSFRERPYPGGLTYSGHPLACASAVASIRIMHEEGIVEHARHLGQDVFGPGLRELAAAHPVVGDVRGLGVFWALELVKDRATREPLVPPGATGADNAPMAEFTAACKKAGLWPFIGGNRTHVVPPATITDEDAREGLERLDAALGSVDRYAS
ncbi:aspartate aminotransferase family protein [Agilicoccus flavus]|uniref:aspartate aminotransferase family protein n=1 Tax=Agilicoccus flavus TaxID=2775968 RepID=UPI001CF63482|nr:aspartate aminotransferase family protein [Agilicoccus flavus]